MIVKPPPNLSSFIHEDEPVPGWVSGGGGRAARAVCSIYSIQLCWEALLYNVIASNHHSQLSVSSHCRRSGGG